MDNSFLKKSIKHIKAGSFNGHICILLLAALFLPGISQAYEGYETIADYVGESSSIHGCRLLCQQKKPTRPNPTIQQQRLRVENVQKRLNNLNSWFIEAGATKFTNSIREQIADPIFYSPESIGVVSLRNVDKVEYLVWKLEEADSEYRNKYWKELIKWGRTKTAPKFGRGK